MATRKAETEVSNETAEAPSVMPPPGVEADVATTIKYRRRVDPDDPRYQPSDLADLAAEEAANLAPPDPLARFLEEWSQYAGYNCEIVRLPDAADKRMPGNHYARPNFSEIERLGGVPFDPLGFVGMLQMINGYSGGAFRVWLTDQSGQMVPGARLDRFAIADPPNSGAGRSSQQHQSTPGNSGPQGYGYAPAPVDRQPSAAEKQLANLQTRLLDSAIDRLMNPEKYQPQQQPPPAPQLTQEQQLAMAVFNQSDLLSSVIQKVANAVQSPDNATQPTWKDKAVEFVMQQPAVAERLTATIERIVTAVLPGRTTQPEYIPPAQPAGYSSQATTTPQTASNMPTEAPDDSEDQDDEDMAIIDELLALLSGDAPLTADEPVFKQLRKDYPLRFPVFNQMLAQLPLDNVCELLSAQSNLYRSLLNSSVSGPHLRRRIAELQALCIQALKPKAAPAPAEASSPKSQVSDQANSAQ